MTLGLVGTSSHGRLCGPFLSEPLPLSFPNTAEPLDLKHSHSYRLLPISFAYERGSSLPLLVIVDVLNSSFSLWAEGPSPRDFSPLFLPCDPGPDQSARSSKSGVTPNVVTHWISLPFFYTRSPLPPHGYSIFSAGVPQTLVLPPLLHSVRLAS